jgi:hypothetical protein
MSRLRGSIEIGPHGLSHFMPFMAATTASGLGVAIVIFQRLATIPIP